MPACTQANQHCMPTHSCTGIAIESTLAMIKDCKSCLRSRCLHPPVVCCPIYTSVNNTMNNQIVFDLLLQFTTVLNPIHNKTGLTDVFVKRIMMDVECNKLTASWVFQNSHEKIHSGIMPIYTINRCSNRFAFHPNPLPIPFHPNPGLLHTNLETCPFCSFNTFISCIYAEQFFLHAHNVLL